MPVKPALLLFFMAQSHPIWASPDPAHLCDAAASRAAAETNVPYDLLRAISRTETGRNHQPLPWAINADGQGTWHDTKDDAVAAATRIIDSGGDVDIGCFQINSHWHSQKFSSLSAMFDPDQNASYASRYLSDLHAKTGDWSAAVAAYHSRDPDRGAAYLARVSATLQTLTDAPRPRAKRNRFPLFMAGDPASSGSLVPRLAGNSPLIGGP